METLDELLQEIERLTKGANAGDNRDTAASPPVSFIHVSSEDVLNFAVAHAGIPIIRRLELRNVSVRTLGGARVYVTVTAPLWGRPIAEWESPVAPLEPGYMQVFDAVPLQLDSGALLGLEESVEGVLSVCLRQDEEEIASWSKPMRLLAHNEFFVSVQMAELVAAHIQPNHPVIVPVLQAAADYLAQKTGDSSLQGYQAGPERAVAIAEAVYEALRATRIGYINPPASFEDTGQKIRTPEQVIGERFGTCLDLACTYAACLEQAGLNPVWCLIRGHAYAGVLVSEDVRFTSPTLTQRNTAINLQDSGYLMPVETVSFTSGADQEFASAVAQAKRHWQDEESFKAVVDIKAARRSGVRPMPVRVVRDGQVTVIVNETVVQQGPVIVEAAQPVSVVRRKRSDAPPRIRHWQASLLDLSLRNPLLNLSTKRTGLAVLVPAGGLGLLETLLMAGHGLSVVAFDALTDLQRAKGVRTVADIEVEQRLALMAEARAIHVAASEDGLARRLATLRDKARLAEEEGGANILHLGLGMLTWVDPAKGVEVRSPILLMPVRLRSIARGRPMELRADEVGGTSNNFVLLEKLRQAYNLRVPELEALDGDVSDRDVMRALDGLRAAIAAQQLDMRVDEEAVLGLFQFGKFRMWKDLDEHWETFLRNPVVSHLVHSAGEPFKRVVPLPATEALDSTGVYCPIPCDGTQLEAVVAAAAGSSFVLEGPPGTGKSQTITNMIANALAAGKRVLFVAEKRAALTVVQNRLAAVGLGPFCLDIHGKGTTGESLRAQLSSSLERVAATDPSQWERGRSELKRRTLALQSYTTALHQRGPHGLSAWSAQQQLAALGDGPVLRPIGTALDAERLAPVPSLLQELPAELAAAGGAAENPWHFVDTGEPQAVSDPSEVRALAEDVREALAELRRVCGETLEPMSYRELVALQALYDATNGMTLRQRQAVAALPMAEEAVRGRALSMLRELHQELAALRQTFRPSIFGVDAATLRSRLAQALGSFFLLRGSRVKPVLAELQPHLAKASAPEQLPAALDTVIACRANADRVTAAVRDAFGDGVRAEWTPLSDEALTDVENVVQAVQQLRAANRPDHARVLLDYSIADSRLSPAVVAALQRFRTSLEALCDRIGASRDALEMHTTSDGILQYANALADGWVADATRGLLSLRRWRTVIATLQRLRESGFPSIREEIVSGRIPVAALPAAVGRGIASAALEERLASAPLATFDGLEHQRLIAQFLEIARTDVKALREVIPDRLVRQRPFTAGETVGEVGRLRRFELLKKKSRTSVRALLKQYCRAIGELAPCFLMSPESVAQFIEPGVLDFDIVIFDEASQVPVPDAIGAIARGRSVVVVGDSRQMPPTAFFSGGGLVEGVEAAEVHTDVPDDLESILSECVGASLDRIWLSWHYRSQSESLIAFSNARYYGGRLSSFPAPRVTRGATGVNWRKVDGGIFDRGQTRTNLREAEAIVAEIQGRVRAGAAREASIGVVTFNLEQAELVAELLEEAASQDPALDALLRDEDPEHRLFVKNLENVQGDERDVILLSVGFARDAAGYLPMNFGPLNRLGGERRWNVAVTRARREVMLFSSIEPEDIDISRVGAGADGVRHLRAYMEMARDGVGRLGDVAALGQQAFDAHRERIADTLRDAGIIVETDIGLSSFKVDLALAHPEAPERQLVAVLLDGTGYANRRTVEDREALPVSVLEHLMQWKATARIWLPEWLNDRNRVIADLQGLVDRWHRAGTEPAPEPSVAAGSGDVVPTVGSRKTAPGRVSLRALQVMTGGGQAFTPFKFADGDLGDLAALEQDIAGGGARVRVAAEQVLDVEGPTELTRLGRIIGRRFGLGRVRTERVTAIAACLPRERIRASSLGEFLWPVALDSETWREYRSTPAGCDRPLDAVAPEESRNAMIDLTVRGLRMTEDELLVALGEVFGIQRLTTALREQLQARVSYAVSAGAIRREGDAFVSVASNPPDPQLPAEAR
jgi:hypothetical protein